MQKYINAIADKNGKPVTGASVLVLNYPAGTQATIYSDNSFSAQANPLTTDLNGAFSFYAVDGRYTIQISGSGLVTQTIKDILIEDPTDGGSPGSFTTLTVATTATLAGSPIQSLASLGASGTAAAIGSTGGTVQTDLDARPTRSSLSAPGTAAIIGSSAGTVQTDIDARPTSSTLAASSGSSLVGFIQSGTGAVARLSQDKMRDWVSLGDFAGADPTGATSSVTALSNALATGKDVLMFGGTWKLDGAITAANHGHQRIIGVGPATLSVSLAGSTDIYTMNGPVGFENLTIDFNNGPCRYFASYAANVGNIRLRDLKVQNLKDTDNTTGSITFWILPTGNTFDVHNIRISSMLKKGNGTIADGPGSFNCIYVGGGSGATQGAIRDVFASEVHNIDGTNAVIYEDTAVIYVITDNTDAANRIGIDNVQGNNFGKRLLKIQASNVSVSRVTGASTTGDSSAVVAFLNGSTTPGVDDKYGCSGTNLRAYGLMENAFASSAPGVKWKNLKALTTSGNKTGMSTASFGLLMQGDDQEIDGFDCGSTYLIGLGSTTQIVKNAKMKNLRLALTSAVASGIANINGTLGFDGLTIDGVRAVEDNTWAGTYAFIDTSSYLNGTTVIGHNVIVRDVHVETTGPANCYGLNFKYITNISLSGYRYINTSGNTHFQLAIFENCVNVNVDDVMIEGANTIGVFVKNCTERATINRVENTGATTAAVYSNGSANVTVNNCDPAKVGSSTAITISPPPSATTTVAAATYTVANADGSIINNYATGSCTLTLPSASLWPGRALYVRSLQAQTTVSNAANVVPLAGGAAATAILAATAGKWAKLVSDGTNWQIQAAN